MCNRYSLTKREELAAMLAKFGFQPIQIEQLKLGFNITPTTRVPVIRNEGGKHELTEMPWGIRGQYPGAPLVLNARSEKFDSSRFWKPLAATRRCLMPASGFFDWETKPGGAKQPHLFTVPDSPVFCFAGLWQDGDQPGCTIVTTTPNALVGRIHTRMPVILDDHSAGDWLGDTPLPPGRITELCLPFSAARMQSWPVTPRMSSVNYKEADSILLDKSASWTVQAELF